MPNYEYLSRIHGPEDLKKLSFSELDLLCAELRARLIEVISQNGGHLASNLGVVELTVAMHKVFDCPKDQFVWDVGHQCYTHKILTHRNERFDTIRKEGGISGFPKRCESDCDSFIAGHSSTSIAVATGLAKANTLKGNDDYVLAVIGDGAMTGGLAYEGLNNAARGNDRIIVILNDNEMSISKNVGALARYLSTIRSNPKYFRAKDRVERGLKAIPVVGTPLRDAVFHSKEALKRALYKTTLFEYFGFTYLGPVNGHNIKNLCEVLQRAKDLARPVLIHVETKKGKGYLFAEKNPGAYHGVSKFDVSTGNPDAAPSMNFSSAFGESLTRLADKDERICAITAAMKYGTGLHKFAAKFPSRFFDVGIAEGYALTFAGGLAAGGMIPVFAVYSSFLQRGFDQILHDLSIERQHVVIGVDRAGVVGDDGETHQGLFDISFLTPIPHMEIYSPYSYQELDFILRHCVAECDGPCAIRYPRGREQVVPELTPQSYEEYTLFAPGAKALVVSYGRLFKDVWYAVEEIRQTKPVAVMKLQKIFPLSDECLQIMGKYEQVIFIEETMEAGCIGEHAAARLQEMRCKTRCHIKAIRDFVPQATVAQALAALGLDRASIKEYIIQRLSD
ncbi:1-deoxy-D-xylulose-5-phosphate synthase [Zongyangia hominis]|uniref:1-deoxy-D-xylulose-5-phosphate synthase n=1 Tax=Zongyangia hominis TaxID=2763677 RepID=A0A926IAZ0_9FIRM|nr:1-deoxy-D-xylulose-5-phosphate synthase [Zongyangia hominis]MBC8569595.1 1-deoxy-D-xylulose-5-phosphate synthase [Zongyangia hominis]